VTCRPSIPWDELSPQVGNILSMKHHKPEVLVIIPARGGSKGIPRKNIVDLCGKPLIAYTIEVAQKAQLVSRVVVSTEDEEIAAISESYGAEVPFLRPKNMAGDKACIGESVLYTRQTLKKQGYAPDILLYLYPTHPFRTPKLLDSLIRKTANGFKFAITVKPVEVTTARMFVLDAQKFIRPLTPQGFRRQTGKQILFKFCGTGYAINHALRQPPFKTFLYHLLEPVTHIDIDHPSDLKLAAEVINRGFFGFDLQ
jgi:CMP-N-acetylneuraminic acid synthetase